MVKKNHNEILFIAYRFSEKYGVGSARSRSLAKYLEGEGVELRVLQGPSTNTVFYRYLWLIKTLIVIVFAKEKKVYLSLGPFFLLLPVALISKVFRKKLILDFRDPWSHNILTKYGEYEFNWDLPKSLKYKIAVTIEKLAYRFCVAFIVCTKGMYLAYEKLFQDSEKIHLIQNGFDFPAVNETTINFTGKSIIRCICVGKFAEYNYQKAFQTIQKLLNTLENENKSFQILMIGCDIDLNKQIFKEFQIEDKVEFLPRMSYEQAMNCVMKSDVGLTLIRDEFLDYGTKIFDYIGMGKPVWVLADKSMPFYEEFKSFLVTDAELSAHLDFSEVYAYSRLNRFRKFNKVFGI